MVFYPGSESAKALVREGWNHVMSHRPLAAWASWQRAIRVDPDSSAAAQALGTLELARELPDVARVRYRFREPRDPARRAAWNERLRSADLLELEASADAFADLASGDPGDSSAEFNRGLCLAWAGRNIEAIACLDRAVALDAGAAFPEAVTAWLLAELLRQGGGAETESDDLRFNCTIGWNPDDTAILLREFPEIRRASAARSPEISVGEDHDIEVFEWLDRPIEPAAALELRGWRLPIVLATVFVSRNSLRLSSPRADSLERVADLFFPRLEGGPKRLRREAAPLPLPFQDAALWIFRIPPGVGASSGESLAREAIEHYLENEWIHVERKGLDGRSPLEASVASSRGDVIARAKLTAVVKLREQLGSRPSTSALYKGYPFDRLRRRLGLERELEAAVDPLDLGCAPPVELDQLDAASLDDSRLVEAAESAAGLLDDARTARFAGELVRRGSDARNVDLKPLVSALVRQAIKRGEPDEALAQIERARSLADAPTAATFDVWSAEICRPRGTCRPSARTLPETHPRRRSGCGAGARRRGHDDRQRSHRASRAAPRAGPDPGTPGGPSLARAPAA